ncbi:unnamed protein product [Amoebophrya sp. A120]|nr:unnamed protein product [Amoebophrya sp. A120]|eukprot:GSA120T00019700001.1
MPDEPKKIAMKVSAAAKKAAQPKAKAAAGGKSAAAGAAGKKAASAGDEPEAEVGPTVEKQPKGKAAAMKSMKKDDDGGAVAAGPGEAAPQANKAAASMKKSMKKENDAPAEDKKGSKSVNAKVMKSMKQQPAASSAAAGAKKGEEGGPVAEDVGSGGNGAGEQDQAKNDPVGLAAGEGANVKKMNLSKELGGEPQVGKNVDNQKNNDLAAAPAVKEPGVGAGAAAVPTGFPSVAAPAPGAAASSSAGASGDMLSQKNSLVTANQHQPAAASSTTSTPAKNSEMLMKNSLAAANLNFNQHAHDMADAMRQGGCDRATALGALLDAGFDAVTAAITTTCFTWSDENKEKKADPVAVGVVGGTNMAAVINHSEKKPPEEKIEQHVVDSFLAQMNKVSENKQPQMQLDPQILEKEQSALLPPPVAENNQNSLLQPQGLLGKKNDMPFQQIDAQESAAKMKNALLDNRLPEEQPQLGAKVDHVGKQNMMLGKEQVVVPMQLLPDEEKNKEMKKMDEDVEMQDAFAQVVQEPLAVQAAPVGAVMKKSGMKKEKIAPPAMKKQNQKAAAPKAAPAAEGNNKNAVKKPNNKNKGVKGGKKNDLDLDLDIFDGEEDEEDMDLEELQDGEEDENGEKQKGGKNAMKKVMKGKKKAMQKEDEQGAAQKQVMKAGAKKQSTVAGGEMSYRLRVSRVFHGRFGKTVTSGGMQKKDLKRNKRGKIVSKAKSAAAKKRTPLLWPVCVAEARKELGTKGFGKMKNPAKGGGTPAEYELYRTVKRIYEEKKKVAGETKKKMEADVAAALADGKNPAAGKNIFGLSSVVNNGAGVGGAPVVAAVLGGGGPAPHNMPDPFAPSAVQNNQMEAPLLQHPEGGLRVAPGAGVGAVAAVVGGSNDQMVNNVRQNMNNNVGGGGAPGAASSSSSSHQVVPQFLGLQQPQQFGATSSNAASAALPGQGQENNGDIIFMSGEKVMDAAEGDAILEQEPAQAGEQKGDIPEQVEDPNKSLFKNPLKEMDIKGDRDWDALSEPESPDPYGLKKQKADAAQE